ncbi:MAG: glycogen synthase GlgA [Rhodospirillales bacterium]|nr:glycogen synthase GlgA [Rhodospirillales bacterium]
MTTLQVLAVASEIYPLIKTGGLADVVGALPAALAQEDVAVRTLVPGYPSVLAALKPAKTVMTIGDSFGAPARVLAGTAAGMEILALDAAHLFDRPGNPYSGPDGLDWPDNQRRFAALSRAAADVALGAVKGYRPDVVHAHDWQAGLTFAYMNFAQGRRPGTVMTIHNLAFQGQFSAAFFPMLGLPPQAFSLAGVEYYGGVGYLKAGLHYADRVTTVSPGYAAEIRTPEEGMGFDGLLRDRSATMSGILNGIDTEAWNPQTDPHLAMQYSKASMGRRAVNKAALQSQLGLDQDPEAPLFGVVTRLSWQKGMDLLVANVPTLLGQGAQLAVLGAGEPGLEAGFRAAAASNPGRVGCVIGYDEALAHRVLAASDAVLVPSRFEPCGLTQLYALRYGTVPVVARVGGLSDTVIDANPAAMGRGVATGVQFAPVTYEMMRVAIERSVALYRQPAVWKKLQSNGMASDVSWRDPARRYAALFRELVPAG